MRVLLLGTGMQGRAALHDLAASAAVREVVAADADAAALEALARRYGDRVRCRRVDAADAAALARLFDEGFDVAIDLLPSPLAPLAAAAAVRSRVHLVSTAYATPETAALAAEAEARGVTILPELGMDPGIDLVLMAEAVRGFDAVEALLTYGAGIPEPSASDNPLRYKVSWSLEGVLRAYRRGARVVRGGVEVTIGPDEQFEPLHVHAVAVEGVGALEAYANGDVLRYARQFGVDPAGLREAGRYSLRYPGHSAFWRTLVALHLLDDEPVVVDGSPVDRKRYLAAALEPALRYADGESDLAILRNVVEGRREGRRERVVQEVSVRRDPATGLSAMSRLTGFAASIGAQLIGGGTIARRGLLTPTQCVPFGPFVAGLERRGITIAQRREVVAAKG